jgi:hypothetical protein
MNPRPEPQLRRGLLLARPGQPTPVDPRRGNEWSYIFWVVVGRRAPTLTFRYGENFAVRGCALQISDRQKTRQDWARNGTCGGPRQSDSALRHRRMSWNYRSMHAPLPKRFRADLVDRSIGRNQRNHGGQRALLARCRSLTSFELRRENVSSGQSARRISSISSSSAISQSNGWQWPPKPTPVPQLILQSCRPVTKGSPLASLVDRA